MFGRDDLAWVSFGAPIRSFRFDTQVSHRPNLAGPVVASLAINRDRRAHLCLYPVVSDSYPEAARAEMLASVLPRFLDWLRAKRAQPVTAILGHEQIIVEWTAAGHRFHELRFL